MRTGKARAVKYRSPDKTPAPDSVGDANLVIPISSEGRAVQEYVRRPLQGREPVGYKYEFLEDYIPNHTCTGQIPAGKHQAGSVLDR